MDRQQRLPIREFVGFQGSDDLNTGVRNENVDPSKVLGDGIHAGLNLRFIGHIHDDAEGPLAAGIQFLGCRDRLFLIEVCDGHAGSLSKELAGDFLADAAGGARDDGNLVGEAHAWTFP